MNREQLIIFVKRIIDQRYALELSNAKNVEDKKRADNNKEEMFKKYLLLVDLMYDDKIVEEKRFILELYKMTIDDYMKTNVILTYTTLYYIDIKEMEETKQR